MASGGHLDFGNINTDQPADALNLAIGQSGMVTPRPKETNPRRKCPTPRPETSARFIPFVPGTEDSDVFQTIAFTTAIEVKWAGKKMREVNRAA